MGYRWKKGEETYGPEQVRRREPDIKEDSITPPFINNVTIEGKKLDSATAGTAITEAQKFIKEGKAYLRKIRS